MSDKAADIMARLMLIMTTFVVMAVIMHNV